MFEFLITNRDKTRSFLITYADKTRTLFAKTPVQSPVSIVTIFNYKYNELMFRQNNEVKNILKYIDDINTNLHNDINQFILIDDTITEYRLELNNIKNELYRNQNNLTPIDLLKIKNNLENTKFKYEVIMWNYLPENSRHP
jgi:hypothetical protein